MSAPEDPAGRSDPSRRGWVLPALLAVLLVGALVAVWGWRGGGVDTPPDVAVPTPAPTSTAQPDPVPAEPPREDGTVTATSPAPAPTPSPAPAPTATTAPAPVATSEPTTELAQPKEGPVHVTVSRGADVLVDAPVALTGLNERAELNPPGGVVGWYGPPDWATVPGELSSYPGVLAGHTTYDGGRDVFYRLGEVRAGDTVTIRYADGQQATFSVDADALSVPKNDVTEKADAEYAWVWSLPEPGRKVSLFSCDLARGLDLTGHSVNNWVVQATRTG